MNTKKNEPLGSFIDQYVTFTRLMPSVPVRGGLRLLFVWVAGAGVGVDAGVGLGACCGAGF